MRDKYYFIFHQRYINISHDFGLKRSYVEANAQLL